MAQTSVQSMLRKASKASATGDHHQAVEIYFNILDKRPMNKEAIKNSIACCEIANDTHGLIRALKFKTRAATTDPEAWCELGRRQLETDDIEDGIKSLQQAIRVLPSHPASLLRLAEYYCRHGNYVESMKFFDVFLGYYPKDSLPPIWLIYYLKARLLSMTTGDDVADVVEENFDAITSDYETLIAILNAATNLCEHELVSKLSEYGSQHFPEKFVVPDLFLNWARSLSILGQREKISSVFDIMEEQFKQKMEDGAAFEHYTAEDLFVILARVAELAGKDNSAYLERALQRKTPGDMSTLEPNMMGHFRAIEPQWKERFEDKDICLLLNGPSLGNLEDRIEELKDCKNTRFIVLNFFSSVNEKILSRLGRNPDAILMVSGIAFAQQIDEIMQCLDSESLPYLITKTTLIGSQKEGEEIIKKQRQLFVMNSRNHSPGSATNCLSFESSNSLSCVIPILMTASPRRIFIFGADGGRSSKEEGVYFGGGQRPDQANNQVVNDTYLDVLAREAAVCDNIMEFQLPWVARLHDVEIPKIYNVCPTSNYHYFDKTDIDTAMNMLVS